MHPVVSGGNWWNVQVSNPNMMQHLQSESLINVAGKADKYNYNI